MTLKESITATSGMRKVRRWFFSLAARGESLAAFDGRCIPAGCVAPRSNTPGILGRRALPAGRLARLGATPDFHHGLLGVGFYGTFVLQNLWNWFVVPAMSVSPISYWLMFGLNMFVQTIRGDPDLSPLMQHASLSDEEKQRVEETLTNEKMWTEVLLPNVFTRLLGLTATLATGWAIHLFLM